MELEYLFDYKEYPIFQDMENGYYMAFNQHEEPICNEATIKMAMNKIDDILLNEEESLKVTNP